MFYISIDVPTFAYILENKWDVFFPDSPIHMFKYTVVWKQWSSYLRLSPRKAQHSFPLCIFPKSEMPNSQPIQCSVKFTNVLHWFSVYSVLISSPHYVGEKETITVFRKYRFETIDSRPQGIKRLVTFKGNTKGDFQLLLYWQTQTR